MELTDEQRFWMKVDRSAGPDACWPWTASTGPQGYGWFWDRHARTMRLAHRISYMLAVGSLGDAIPRTGKRDGMLVVCHRCDNPSCVNPTHLFLGTQQDNMDDCRVKGRTPDNRNERNPRSKLTPQQVAEIRASVTGRHGERSALARQYGISTAQVSKILLGQSWAA